MDNGRREQPPEITGSPSETPVVLQKRRPSFWGPLVVLSLAGAAKFLIQPLAIKMVKPRMGGFAGLAEYQNRATAVEGTFDIIAIALLVIGAIYVVCVAVLRTRGPVQDGQALHRSP